MAQQGPSPFAGCARARAGHPVPCGVRGLSPARNPACTPQATGKPFPTLAAADAPSTRWLQLFPRASDLLRTVLRRPSKCCNPELWMTVATDKPQPRQMDFVRVKDTSQMGEERRGGRAGKSPLARAVQAYQGQEAYESKVTAKAKPRWKSRPPTFRTKGPQVQPSASVRKGRQEVLALAC